jgi:tryptophan-rich sensory protein
MRRRSAGPGVWAAFLASSYLAAAVGSAYTSRGLRGWYQRLRKPGWTPSGRLIGRVWTVLYLLIALAGLRSWRADAPRAERTRTLGWYAAQLGLNALWSAVFFGLRAPGAALVTLVALWVAVAGWMRAMAGVDRVAVALAAPYLIWVTFAGALNAAIWRRNRRREPGASGLSHGDGRASA